MPSLALARSNESIAFNSASGSITGTVIETHAGTRLSNTSIQFGLYDAGGNLLGSQAATTDKAGAYHLDGVPSGDLYLTAKIMARGFKGTQLYPGIDCPADTCPPVTTGQRLTITSGSSTDGINFGFSPTSVVHGIVTDASTGQPLGGMQISACIEGTFGPLCWFGTRSADLDGSYNLFVDAGWHYMIVAWATDAYANQMYPAIPCSDQCGRDLGNGFHVAAGDRINGIDFTMHRSARLAGIVRDATTGEPLPGAFIAAYDATYQRIWTASADETGTYVGAKWQGGTYYVFASKGWPLRCTFYLDRPCPVDDSTPISSVQPTPITVADGQNRSDIDIRILGPVIFSDGFDTVASPP